MLLVHPIREVIRFLPVLIVFAVARTAAGGEQWQLFGVAIPIALGLLRYLTTSFRINGGRIELQRGLFNRHVLSTPVDRVRTVDLTSSLIHRMLGLTKVRIGTGTASTSDEDRIDLDGLPLERARALRAELLRTSTADDEVAAEQAPEREVVTFDRSWVRFAPLTGSGVVIGAAALGAASQLLQATDFFERFNPETVDRPGLSLLVLVPLLVLGVARRHLAALDRRVRRHQLGVPAHPHPRSRDVAPDPRPVHHPRDHARRRPARRRQPVRAARAPAGRRRPALGDRHRPVQESAGQLQPGPARPRAALVEQVAGEVLDTTVPVEATLTPHGPRATRRRWTRALTTRGRA